MRPEARGEITDQLREIRLLIEDGQHQDGKDYRDTVGRILTDIVNALELLADTGGSGDTATRAPRPAGGSF